MSAARALSSAGGAAAKSKRPTATFTDHALKVAAAIAETDTAGLPSGCWLLHSVLPELCPLEQYPPLFKYIEEIPPTLSFMRKEIHRRQATLFLTPAELEWLVNETPLPAHDDHPCKTAKYKFGRQTTQSCDRTILSEPPIRAMFKHVAAECRRLKLDVSDYTMVHLNFYPYNRAGLGRHADDEACILPDTPIFSFTLTMDESGHPGKPRTMKFFRGKTNHVCRAIALEHGACVVMGGQCQRKLEHQIPAASTKKTEGESTRINVTIRAFNRNYVPP
jgi:alkylated DNA repair dioxygenase AlkB